ncbi:MAG: hypothetical protein HFH75_02620 [Lachnospiraceae bacterium]|jgi:hypothetical protein|nr:hypothetical protein [Lachnospiraceae bacterium]MCI8966467.1 hypothetical protein [Lachnospiraceae bacterium]
MKIIVTFGPVIGGVILAAYVVVLRIYAYVKEKDTVAEKYKRIYKLMIIAEAVLCGITFFVPRVTGESYLPDGTTQGGVIVNTKSAFQIAYKESNRGYSDTLELDEEDLARVHVRCSSDEGKVFLQIRQEQTQKEIDITNTDSLLDMTDFLPGRITFTMVNENGRNVDFELEWRETT